MAQAVSRRPPTAEARVRSRVSPCGICGGKKWHWDRFFPEFFGFPLSVSFHWCSITRKRTKKIIIFLIIGLHNKPQGCSASVASAAGPFTTKKKLQSTEERQSDQAISGTSGSIKSWKQKYAVGPPYWPAVGGLSTNISREKVKFRENLYSRPNSARCFLCMPKHLREHLQLTEKCLNVL
jgi:hypothetical protein